jgi:hypothetical protein
MTDDGRNKEKRMKDKKREEIKITFVGTKKFKQLLVNKVYELLMEENFLSEATKPGCGLTFTSSMEPDEECF